MGASADRELHKVAGSFRDPAGQVFQKDGHIYRTVNPVVSDDFDFVRSREFYSQAISDRRLIAAEIVPNEALAELGESGGEAEAATYVLEHPRLRFVSYPYEWSFPTLKLAALFHLDFHLDALRDGVSLIDASAYNIQFVGSRPIFIDTLSLRKYQSGALWEGYRQFCEQFLNPLLLRACLGVSHNSWYRGNQEGISTADIRKLLPIRRKFSRRVLTHIVLQDSLQRSGSKSTTIDQKTLRAAGFPLATFQKTLTDLRNWIAALEPAKTGATVWRDYASANSYDDDEAARKKEFVADFVRRRRPAQIWDLGCNTGDYSAAALEAGAESAIGFDFDQGALELAFSRAQQQNLAFLPLYLDISNPPPSQGWAQNERQGLNERAKSADGLIALALIHHLSIARNVPLPDAIDWLLGLAPHGVIEFVPKEDPMVQELLRFRDDIFPDYTVDHFLQHLGRSASIERQAPSSSTGRLLVEYSRIGDGGVRDGGAAPVSNSSVPDL